MKMHTLCLIFFSSINIYAAQSGSELIRSKTQPHLQRQQTVLQKTASIIVHAVQQQQTTIKRAQSASALTQHTKQDRVISDSTIREVSSEPGSPTYGPDSWVKALRCPGEKICPRCVAGEICERSLRSVGSFVQQEPFDTTNSTEFAS